MVKAGIGPLTDGFLGGALGVFLLLADLAMRYAL